MAYPPTRTGGLKALLRRAFKYQDPLRERSCQGLFGSDLTCQSGCPRPSSIALARTQSLSFSSTRPILHYAEGPTYLLTDPEAVLMGFEMHDKRSRPGVDRRLEPPPQSSRFPKFDPHTPVLYLHEHSFIFRASFSNHPHQAGPYGEEGARPPDGASFDYNRGSPQVASWSAVHITEAKLGISPIAQASEYGDWGTPSR